MQHLLKILRCRALGLAILFVAPSTSTESQAAKPAPYPPLRLAGSGGPSPAVTVTGPAPAAAHPAASPAARAASPTVVPDERWCGIETSRPAPEPPLPCKHPGLPCGPVSAGEISRGAGEIGEDLDGDSQPDLTLAGRREVPKPEIYAAIYRSSNGSYVLADYHAVPLRSEPTVATVLLAAPGSPPLLRDGYDVLEPGGRTLSIARLRRFDGQRFRTLLTFCAHRAESSAGTMRDGHNRVEILDIDKDGQKDVVIHGLSKPVAFRMADGGLSLIEDATLSQLYRDSSPEIRRAQELRAESAKLVEAGQLRRAAESLQRAHASMPYDVGLTIDLCGLLLRTGQADQAVQLLGRARFQAPDKAPVYCALARAYRAQGAAGAAAERIALRSCLSKSPDESSRIEAEARLRELSGHGPSPGPAPALYGSPDEVDQPGGPGVP